MTRSRGDREIFQWIAFSTFRIFVPCANTMYFKNECINILPEITL